MTSCNPDWLDYPEPYHAERIPEYLSDQVERLGLAPCNGQSETPPTGANVSDSRDQASDDDIGPFSTGQP
jgi:hypothetical protein